MTIVSFRPSGEILVNHKDPGNALSTAHAGVSVPMTALLLFEILQILSVDII